MRNAVEPSGFERLSRRTALSGRHCFVNMAINEEPLQSKCVPGDQNRNHHNCNHNFCPLFHFLISLKSAEAAAENEDTRLVCHFRLVEQVLESLLKIERSTAALQDANAGVSLLSKNAPFKSEQFAERPCLERTAARSVRRFGVTNFR